MKNNTAKVQSSPSAGQGKGAEEIVQQFSKSFSSSERVTSPYHYYVFRDALPEAVVDDILALPVEAPKDMDFSKGTREVNNKLRTYFSPDNQKTWPVCKAMVDAFKDPRILSVIKEVTGRDVSEGQLRIEYCQDTDGFWLEPHVDISVKLYSMLVYLSDDPALYDAGTDVYDDTPEHKLVARVPYERNVGMTFIPAHNTWHGFAKRKINGIRKSLIINYVKKEWRAVEELA
ncbi:MAG: 2OG-Fe(II) oxygenase [Alphaproteobacteria bacterium]|nr:2OG-Fe(II) oxygenase [Alphaproteobacteria bacterium]MCB1838929.1 2OG-Fe(II) oxygenase [Alphaproteobacteria bacterium]